MAEPKWRSQISLNGRRLTTAIEALVHGSLDVQLVYDSKTSLKGVTEYNFCARTFRAGWSRASRGRWCGSRWFVRQLLECSIPQSTHARASFRAGAKTQAQELIKRDKVGVILGPFALSNCGDHIGVLQLCAESTRGCRHQVNSEDLRYSLNQSVCRATIDRLVPWPIPQLDTSFRDGGI
jgi:hypothetical protein